MRPREVSHTLRAAVLSAAALLAVSGGGVMAAQRSPGMNSGRALDPPSSGVPPLQVPAPGTTDSGAHADERAKAMDADRRKRLAADVDRLVSLTNELKSDIDKTTKDQLSLEVIKKAQEIEKLAHDVQNRLKN
jgi:hypothetical protein